MAYAGALMRGFSEGMDTGHRWQDHTRRQEEEDFLRMEKRLGMAGESLAALFTDPETGFQMDPSKITQAHADQMVNIINRYGIASSFFGINKDVAKRNPLAKARIIADPTDPNVRRVAFDLNMRNGEVKPMTWGRGSNQDDPVAFPTLEDVGKFLLIETNPQYVQKSAQAEFKYNNSQRRRGGGGRRRRGGGGGGGDSYQPAAMRDSPAPGQGAGTEGPMSMKGQGMEMTAIGPVSPIGGPEKEQSGKKKNPDPRHYGKRPTKDERADNRFIDRYGEDAYWEKYDRENLGTGGKKAGKGKEEIYDTTFDEDAGTKTEQFGIANDSGEYEPTKYKVTQPDGSFKVRKGSESGNALDYDEPSWTDPYQEYVSRATTRIQQSAIDWGTNRGITDSPAPEQEPERETAPDDFDELEKEETALKPEAKVQKPKGKSTKGKKLTKKQINNLPLRKRTASGKTVYRTPTGKYATLVGIKQSAKAKGVPWERLARQFGHDPFNMK